MRELHELPSTVIVQSGTIKTRLSEYSHHRRCQTTEPFHKTKLFS